METSEVVKAGSGYMAKAVRRRQVRSEGRMKDHAAPAARKALRGVSEDAP